MVTSRPSFNSTSIEQSSRPSSACTSASGYDASRGEYRLKRSLRAWFGRFANVMKNMGYRQSQGDYTLFIKHKIQGEL